MLKKDAFPETRTAKIVKKHINDDNFCEYRNFFKTLFFQTINLFHSLPLYSNLLK